MFVHFLCVQIRKHPIPKILEDQCLSAIANNNPITGIDFHFRHCSAPKSSFRLRGADAFSNGFGPVLNSEPAPEIAPVVAIAVTGGRPKPFPTAEANGPRKGLIAPDQQVSGATADLIGSTAYRRSVANP